MVLFLFAHREAEVAELSAEGEVFAVSVSHKSALLEVELALAVDEAFIGVDTDYLRKEHRVRAEKLRLRNTALEIDGTLLDKWSADLVSRSSVQTADLEFIGILTALYAAEVGSPAHSGGSEVYDEFAAVLDYIVRKTLGAD